MWAEGGKGRVEGRNTAYNIRSAPPITRTCHQCVACREEVGLKLILFHNNSLCMLEMWTILFYCTDECVIRGVQPHSEGTSDALRSVI